jgi:hypothetical protein
LTTYLLHVQKLEKDFEVLDLQHVPRANNAVTDELPAKASMWALVPDGVFERKLQRPTTRPAESSEGGEKSTPKLAVLMVLIPWSPPRIIGITGDSVHPSAQDPEAQVGSDAWIMEIRSYLKDNILPDDSASTDWIARLAKRYTLAEVDLYRCGANDILMRCITREEGCVLLIEVHGGMCENYASPTRWSVKPFGMAFTGLQPSRTPSSW